MDDSEKNIASICIATLIIISIALSILATYQSAQIEALKRSNEELKEYTLIQDSIISEIY